MFTFGARDAAAQYVLRPGGYVILPGPGERLAVVVTPHGVYLPGGGQEAGESAEEAAVREVEEECGLKVAVVQKLGVADELVYDSSEGRHYQKRCEFFLGRVIGEASVAWASEHRLVWLSRQEARARLSHGSQRWALSLWG